MRGGKVIALALGVMAATYAVMAAAYAVITTATEPASGADSKASTVATEHAMASQPAVEIERGTAPRRPSSPASLAGTDPDGDLTVTVSRGTIRLFDYYLTTLGETDLAGVRALVAAEAQRQVPDTATDVLALFDRYTAYLEDLRDVHAATVDDYFAQTLALQQRHFGADAETLFGEDNAVAARLVASAAAKPVP